MVYQSCTISLPKGRATSRARQQVRQFPNLPGMHNFNNILIIRYLANYKMANPFNGQGVSHLQKSYLLNNQPITFTANARDFLNIMQLIFFKFPNSTDRKELLTPYRQKAVSKDSFHSGCG